MFSISILTRTTTPAPNVRGARPRYVGSGRPSHGVYDVRLSKGNVGGNGRQMYFPLSGLDGRVPNEALTSHLSFSINDRTFTSIRYQTPYARVSRRHT